MPLRPDKMEKIRIIASSIHNEGVITLLHDMRAVQIEPVSKEVMDYFGTTNIDPLIEKVNVQLQKMKTFEGALPPTPFKEKRRFQSIDEAISAASEIDLSDQIKQLKGEEEDVLADIKDIRNRMETVHPLIGLDLNLNIFNTDYTKSYLLTGSEESDPVRDIKAKIPSSAIIKTQIGSHVVSILKNNDKDLAAISNEKGYKLLHVPEMSGRPDEYYDKLMSRLDDRNESLNRIKEELIALSGEYYRDIVQIREQLDIELKKLEVIQKSLSSDAAFAIEGWIRKRDRSVMEKRLEKVTKGSVLVQTVKTKQMPPTVMHNPKGFKVFEFFIRFYSLPLENEFDPTLIFALIFPFFFGMMIGDWGYGLVVLLGSLWLVRIINHPEKKHIYPKKLGGFAVKILGKGPLLVLGKVLIPSSLVAMGIGLYFNNVFGFQLPFYRSVGLITTYGIEKLLLVSGYIGLAMVSFGFILNIINSLILRENERVYSSVGWLMLAWGISITGLNVLHTSIGSLTLNPMVDAMTAIPIYMIIVGIVMVAILEKTQGMIEVPSLISHILSYTRLVGILLASVILAYVVDTLFLGSLHNGIVSIIMMGFVLVLGQVFNLAIAIFEPGIQGARLLYVEFFSKFYKGNGKQFRPFGTERKFTLPENEEK